LEIKEENDAAEHEDFAALNNRVSVSEVRGHGHELS
jgi:hypothetical protein